MKKKQRKVYNNHIVRRYQQKGRIIYIMHYVLNIRMNTICLNEEEAKKGV